MFVNQSFLIIPTIFHQRKTVNRIENYFEVTIPRYSPDDFRSHFRLTRESFDNLTQKISECGVYNQKSGPPVDPVKDVLMFLWYIGMHILYCKQAHYVCEMYVSNVNSFINIIFCLL